jgi:hypothetical protein
MEDTLKLILKTLFFDGAPYYYIAITSSILYYVLVLRSKLVFRSFHETADLMNKATWKEQLFLLIPCYGCVIGSIKVLTILTDSQNSLPLYIGLVYQSIVALAFLYVLKYQSFNGRYLYLFLSGLTVLVSLLALTILQLKDAGLGLLIAGVFQTPVIYGMGCTVFLNTRSGMRQ